MTTKTLSATYASGYTLNSKYSYVSITSTGLVEGIGLRLTTFGTVENSGKLEGSVSGLSSGVALDAGGYINNSGSIYG